MIVQIIRGIAYSVHLHLSLSLPDVTDSVDEVGSAVVGSGAVAVSTEDCCLQCSPNKRMISFAQSSTASLLHVDHLFVTSCKIQLKVIKVIKRLKFNDTFVKTLIPQTCI